MRLEICQLLMVKQYSVGELCETLNLRQYVVSQQLALLRKTEIVGTQREARSIIYSLSNDKVCRVLRVTIANLVRSSSQADISNIGRNRQAGVFAKVPGMVKRFLFALFFTAITHSVAADARLIMVTSEHCPYCQAWERDVGAVYDKSPYAAKLPLTRVEIGIKMPENVAIKKPVVGTPTFLIIRDGHEIDRQRGYIDAEMFFWWLSEQIS